MNKWLYLLLCFSGLAHAEVVGEIGIESTFGKVKADDSTENIEVEKKVVEPLASPPNSRTYTELSPHLHNHFSSNNELLEWYFPPSGEKCQIGILENRYGAKLVLIGTSDNVPPRVFDYGDYLAYRNQQGIYAEDFAQLRQSVHTANRNESNCYRLKDWIIEHKIK